MGLFTLNGPLTQDVVCALTASCVVQVTGTGLANTNRARVVEASATCAVAATLPAGYTGASLDVSVSSSPYREFNFGTATAGLANTAYQICWAADSSYSFRVGSFQIFGPFTTNTGCTLTEVCAIQLSGVGLASTNAVRILESVSSCGSTAAAVSTFTGLAVTTSASSAAPHANFSLGTATGGISRALFMRTNHNLETFYAVSEFGCLG